jgi:hypothetical protein
VLARTATGIFSQALNDVAGIIQQWGIYGREGYNLLGNDPRETGEEIRGPQEAGGRAGGIWAGGYQAIRTNTWYRQTGFVVASRKQCCKHHQHNRSGNHGCPPVFRLDPSTIVQLSKAVIH